MSILWKPIVTKAHEQKLNRTPVQCTSESLPLCNLRQVFDVMHDNMIVEIYCNFYSMWGNHDR